MIERLITIGLINSTEFIQQVSPVWEHGTIISSNLQLIAGWCFEYYDEFQKAPGRTLEDIYFDKKTRREISKDLIDSLEDDLEDLAEEYDESFNVQYALKQTTKYLQKRSLEIHQKAVKELIDAGEEGAAVELASSYRPIRAVVLDDLDLSGADVLLKVENVFTGLFQSLLEYPGKLGEILNEQMVRGAFVAFMAPEKRGKSFWLLDMAIKATLSRSKVAFFQAGDMTEGQQLKRICSYLAKKPISEKYLGEVYIPEIDCIMNQLDECEKEERSCGFGALTDSGLSIENIRKEITKAHLVEAYADNGADYTICTNCAEFRDRPWGTPWLIPKTINRAVTAEEAKRKIQQFFIDKKRRFRLSTHPNSTLSVSAIKSIINRWEHTDGFIPDVIVIDYADLLISNVTEFRHAQNDIWKNLRALSQERDCLVVTATQADAKSYDTNLLKMSNFSEDKRKFAHCTAMFGLNQDKLGREKKMGLLRINELVVREGEFDSMTAVTVLQNLNLGRPFLDSYI